MKLVLILIWLSLLVEILILAIIKPFTVDFQLVSIMAVSLHVLFTMGILIAYRNEYNMIFLWAFLARVAFMLWDIYARHIYSLPNSGYDSNAFYRSAILISQDLSLLSETIRGGYYAKTIGIIFNWIGPQQMLGHYLNVLLGLTVVYVIYKILIILELKPNVVKLTLLIAAFFPNSLVMSAILLREMVITFFVATSLYFFIKWFKNGHNLEMIFSIIFLGLASIFHSGVTGIYFGYAFIFIFYSQEKKTLRLHSKSVPVFFILLAFALIAVTVFSDIILSDFLDSEGMIDVYETADYRRGESVYLTNITINNPFQFIVYAPIKAFYFLTAPLPMNWRGPMDIFSFISDSFLYLGTIIYFITNKKNLKDKKVLAFGLLLVIISVSLVFGIGVSNAGTAIRHRHKIVPIFLVLLAVMIEGKIQFTDRIDHFKKQSSRQTGTYTDHKRVVGYM